MATPHQNRFAKQDKHLISEQPGMTVLVAGILLALFLGFLIRGFIAPARVQGLLQNAARNIHKEIEVTFTDAQVSLNDGILPRFAVVVSGVQMQSQKNCWMAPQVQIDELRLPISIWGLVTGQSIIDEVQADTVTVNLRGPYQNCQREDVLGHTSAATGVASPPTGKLVSLQVEANSESPPAQNALKEISIGKLKVLAESYPHYNIELNSLSVRLKKESPRWIVLKAKTHLFRDEQVGDYLSHANIHIEYNEAAPGSLQAHFFGNWREGHYSLIGNYGLVDKALILEMDLKHIPFSQVISLMQKYELADPMLNPRQLWLSLNARYSGGVDKIVNSPFEITNLSVDGDQIEIDSDRILFKSLQPLQYDPIVLNINKINIDKIFSFFNRPRATKIFNHMGSFAGQAEIRSGQDIRLRGAYSGVEFIFSNKSQREIQAITTMNSTAEFKDERWKILLSNITPVQGAFDGDMQVETDKTFAEMNVKVRANRALLSPKVQSLMTQGGEIGPLKINLDLSTRTGRLTHIKGNMQLSHMKLEGMEIKEPKLKMNFVNQQMVMDVSLADLKMQEHLPVMQTLSPVFSDYLSKSTVKEMQLSNLTGQLMTDEFRTLNWKKFSGMINKNIKVSTEGSWDNQGQLNGQIMIRDKQSTRWNVMGTREKPEFVRERRGVSNK